MPFFTIEATYRIRVYRQRTYEADTVEQACHLAIEDDDWSDQKDDFESSGETYITGAWPGSDSAYRVTALPVPSQFGETMQRKTDHFETLLGILKVLAHASDGAASDPPFWRQRADAAIAKAEAILAGAPGLSFLETHMADYFEQTVVQQTIPTADMTPLERLLLSHIFECEPDGDGWYFFAEQSPSTMIFVTRAELQAALASSPDVESAAHLYVTEQLATENADATEIDLDLSGTSWEFFFQDIVKRSKTLAYVSVVAAFTCSKMRPDGFGGMALLITRDAIVGKSTNDLIEDFLAEARLDGGETPGAEVSDAATVPPASE